MTKLASRQPPLADSLTSGILAFPITDYEAEGAVNLGAFADRVAWMQSYGPAAFFPCAGAGEFFSLQRDECNNILSATIEASDGKTPVIASAGMGTVHAVQGVKDAESLGADGVLLLPPYLTGATQEGLTKHISEVCNATGLDVIVYNRANCQLHTETVLRLADKCINFAGLKDGSGDLEKLVLTRLAIGDRLMFLNGMPTAELYAYAYGGMNILGYTSGVFNFVPDLSMLFHRAFIAGDRKISDRIMSEFFRPYADIRGNKPGYAVSILRAGAEIIGHGAGKVRPPLCEISSEEYGALESLIANTEYLTSQ